VMDVNVAMDGRRFRCVIANDVDPGAVSEAATLAVDGSQLTNLSSRSFVGSGDGIQIAGFVVAGVGSKPILIRSAGPALSTRFQLSGALMNPTLSLYGGPTVLATNSGWSRSPNSAAIAVTSVAVGAFPWEVGSNDSAILATLPPGGFTAQISGLADAAGTALVEVYDADPAAPGRLVNLSTRARVKAGDDILIAGFVIAGNQPKRVLVRASGPALKANFGLADVLADPELTLFQGSARLDSNTGWSSAPNASAIETVATSLGAFPTPSASKDSALLSTLPPGAYTAQVRSLSGNSGLVIVEVYDADRR